MMPCPWSQVLGRPARVTTPEQWKKRRAEINAMFDEDVYGKFPAHIPKVTWKVDTSLPGNAGQFVILLSN